MRIQSLPVTLVILSLVAVLAIGGCASASPTPDTAQAKPVVLRFADFEASGTVRTGVLQKWGEEIEKATQGQVRLEFYWAASLAAAKEVAPAIKNGLAEGGYVSTGTDPTAVLLAYASNLPGVAVEHEIGIPRTIEFYTTNNEMTKQFADRNLVLMHVYAHPGPTMILSKKRIDSLADLKGLKVRSLGEWGEVVGALGATPVPLAANDVYVAVQRGTVDGVQSWMLGFMEWKWAEAMGLNAYMVPLGIGTPVGGLHVLGKNSWDSISPKNQQAIRDANQKYVGWMIDANNAKYSESVEAFKKMGGTILPVNPEIQAAAAKKAGELQKAWISKIEGQGLPAQAIVDGLRATYAKK